MLLLDEVTDIRHCEDLWREAMPSELVTDLWEVRECFHRHFRRPPRFISVRQGSDLVGLLPLSWIEETGRFGIFPGETWKGRTWLEQNRVIARDQEVLSLLLSACPAQVELRYLLPLPAATGVVIDEVGYLFDPPSYSYDLERWFGEFSGKNAKRLRREIARTQTDLDWRFDDLGDIDNLVEMSLARFGASSYFASQPFLDGFRSLVDLLHGRGWLRVTSLISGDEPVAVDVGCLYGRNYTLFAGGTHADYAGVAKVINLHHLRHACEERLDQVDFLCGEFAWKPLFHLRPRPLYLFGQQVKSASVPIHVEHEIRVG